MLMFEFSAPQPLQYWTCSSSGAICLSTWRYATVPSMRQRWFYGGYHKYLLWKWCTMSNDNEIYQNCMLEAQLRNHIIFNILVRFVLLDTNVPEYPKLTNSPGKPVDFIVTLKTSSLWTHWVFANKHVIGQGYKV